MFKKVLIANRGEIACRVIRTLRRMGVGSVAIYSEADAHAMHVRMADEAICVGGPQVSASYLRTERILEAARESGAEAIHPGYGFLSENTAFAAACAAQGVVFIGPTPEQIRRFGLKHEARALAAEVGVPLLPGSDLVMSLAEAQSVAERIGYPVMLKSTSGGGGIGLRVCRDWTALEEGFEGVRRLAKSHFEGSGMFLEKYLEAARHIEVQIFGDGQGRVLALGERDCSTQRRNQKVIEETPAPGLSAATRAALFESAIKLASAVKYASAGTVEFVLDARTQEFYFLEVNTRLQVEHGVTEEVTGLDLVEWMVRAAAGELQLPAAALAPQGAAIEVRIYAEDPNKGFQPSTGMLSHVVLPQAARCDGWIENGTEITPHYDPLLVKIISHGATRVEALKKLKVALGETQLYGIESNLNYLREILADEAFRAGSITTRYLQGFAYAPRTWDVLDGGTQTTLQDYPGRLGHWAVGVPPSGPMDDLAFRLANRLVGNPEGTPALELTLSGPKLVCNSDCLIAITGAEMGATLEGVPLPTWQAVQVDAGSTLEFGMLQGRGMRAYLAVRGGFDVPQYLGSTATFMLGGFGGHGGRALRAGDVLRLAAETRSIPPKPLPVGERPAYPEQWEIGVLDGPHSAPDFFTPNDIETFFATDFEVHYNSDRTGVRLIGPKPSWARKDGGEAGLHPSNIHDNAYAIGTVDYTGDMPVILGPDGPSLGGFVCPVTIVAAERWKMGQLRAGDKLRFVRLGVHQPAAARPGNGAGNGASALFAPPPPPAAALGVLGSLAETAARPRVVYRRAGDENLLVEYGPLVLDLALRMRVHVLMEALERQQLPGILDLTPGIRSLQVHYAPDKLDCERLVALLMSLEDALPAIDELEIPTRIVRLPLSWEDPATLLAIEKYTRSVRKDAPWCPSNIEFIRRINGLDSIEDVKRIVFDSSYLVLGLGDVYLGAPVATPIDPRHRLVTTKYNPARTWTPENAVGIGGAYLCVYGMEGPGGYQFVGRTVQMWNTYRSTRDFAPGRPWLLRFFDQIQFYPVGADELLKLRADFLAGKHNLETSETTFSWKKYKAFLDENAASIDAWKSGQQAAFEAERERWAAAGQDVVAVEPPKDNGRALGGDALPKGQSAIISPVAGSVWKLLVDVGEQVVAGAAVVIVEAMKTEIVIKTSVSGRVHEHRAEPGSTVLPGHTLMVIDGA
ncbi:MAG TPA: urea carboxylase [Polyangiales bacterium]|nr:urea carboxylase [Polyangiales bacterium]